MWRACKAPSRVQCVLPCGVRVRPPLVFSGTQKLHPLVFSVFFCFLFLLPAAYTTRSKRDAKQKKPPLRFTKTKWFFEGFEIDMLPLSFEKVVLESHA